METIIGLLVILLPIVFKFIGKRLEQSGHPDAAGTIRDFAEMFGSEDDGLHKEEQVSSAPETVVRVDTMATKPRTESVVEVKARKTSSRKPVLVEEKVGKREKIDPKKLVIYSEIMNPKYKDR